MNSIEHGNHEVLRYRFQRDGSLAVQWLELANSRSHYLRIGPGRRVNVLSAIGTQWQEVELRAGSSLRRGHLLLTHTMARPAEGGIEVRYVARNERGRTVESSRHVTGDDDDRWNRVDRRPGGKRFEINGRGTSVWRTAFDVNDLLRWRSEPVGGDAAQGADDSSGVQRRGESILDNEGRQIGRVTTWESKDGHGSHTEISSGSGSYEMTKEWWNDGRIIIHEQFTDGKSKESSNQTWEQDRGLRHSHTDHSDKNGTTSSDDWRGTEKNPITGEDNEVVHVERSSTDSQGKTEDHRSATVKDGHGNESSISSHKNKDDSVTITIKTVDGNRNGTERKITTDPSGRVIKDKTKPVIGGKTKGGDDEEEEDEDSGSDDDDNEDDDDDGDDGDDGDDDNGDDGDDGGDDTGDDDTGDDGDDSGGDDGDMDWDGSGDGRPTLPPLTAALAVEFEVPVGLTPAQRQAWAEGFIATVKALIASGRDPAEGRPRIVPSGRGPLVIEVGPRPGGATGEGDWGLEGLPELRPRVGEWGTLRIGGRQGPTEDWGDWTDPRALIAHALRLTTAVAADRNASALGVYRALNSINGLDAAVTQLKTSE